MATREALRILVVDDVEEQLRTSKDKPEVHNA